MCSDKIIGKIKAGLQPAFFVLPYMPSIILLLNLIILCHFLMVQCCGYRIEAFDIDSWWLSHFLQPSLATVILLCVAGKDYSLFAWYCVLELFALWVINSLHMAIGFDVSNYYCTYIVINGLAIMVSCVRFLTSINK